jgi:hypothetical protein
MILNKDRVRLIARQWRYLVLAGALMALGVWLLSPGRITRTGLAQPQPENTSLKLQLVKSMGDNKAYADLIEMALKNPDGELRRLAAIRLTEIEGDGSADAMFELYQKSDDSEVKLMVIDALARISEIEPLTKIALSETNDEYQRRALMRIKWLQEKGLSSDIKVLSNNLRLQDLLNKLDSAPPPPPPPPPPPSSELTAKAGEPAKEFPWNKDERSVFALLHQMAAASMRRDTAFFERVLDEEYVETGPTGLVMNKVEALADVKRMDYNLKKFEFDAVRYSGNESMGMANFLGTAYLEKDGQESTAQFRYTINFIRRNVNGPMTVLATHISQKQ